ncbi:MAG: DNA mismatch repair protein [Clostridiaceae bacterium]|nr:DNA mismatch repair protein [Clostridiaceae bacterium]
MINAEDQYNKRIKKYKSLINKQTKRVSLLGNLRLLVFLVGTTLTTVLYLKNSHYLSYSIFAVFLILFIWIAVIHSKVIENRNYASTIYDINLNSYKRLKGEWVDFQDTGEEFIDFNHRYSSDLDIFGKNSLFQFINTSSTYVGRLNLKEKLSSSSKSQEDIYLKQEAIHELSKKISFRQRLMAEGIIFKPLNQSMESLYSWGKTKEVLYANFGFISIIRILPLITIILTILPFINQRIPFYVPLIMYLLNSILLLPYSHKRTGILNEVNTYKSTLIAYYNMLKLIEKTKFTSPYLKNIDISSSTKKIDKLGKISEMIAIRSSSLYMAIDILLLWDYQCLIALEKWKKNCGRDLEKWIFSIGEIESLSSLSLINFDNPNWVFPNIVKENQLMNCAELGHPLLSKNRISNSVSFEKNSNILLITGSNMSGKSTFLRTIGINLVLAYAGAPVCAKAFKTPIMNIYTCMRVSDNLEASISSFYAELIRIKMIVSASKQGESIFFLLDEIFKGTNSLDRHTGAKVLINQLRSYGSYGLISTHDLELGELEKESSGGVRNYHFREYYKNDEIHFDYKLRPGVSTTRNALYLIKMAGLDIEGV